MRDTFAVLQRECGSSGVRERRPEVLPGNTLGCIFGQGDKHDRFSGSLAMRAFRRGHLLYHPTHWYEAGYLRIRALDFVELRARNVGHNYRGQPGLTTSDPSKLVGFSSFAAALLLFAQLKWDDIP